MKFTYIIAAFVTLSLFSCDNRADFVAAQNSSPSLAITGHTSDGEEAKFVEVDYKLNKSSDGEYNVRLVPNDGDNNIASFSHTLLEGDLSLDLSDYSYDGEDFMDISLKVNKLGKHRVRLHVYDALGGDDFVELVINAFTNRVPVASFDIDEVNINSNNEYELDASTSYDGDAELGGTILIYKWNINGQEFTTDESKIKWIFGTSGNYEIKLSVMDSDYTWSDEVIVVENI